VVSASPRPPASPSALPVAPGAGQLPQTSALPTTASAAFQNAVADLWLAVTTGQADFGLPAFFPLAAYQKLKDLYEPTEDWRGRLWADFTLDVAAAHRLLREDGGQAQFVRVIVPAAYAAWVSPGVCANYIGYWHIPGARLVYRQDDKERSIGIASLISWRATGTWSISALCCAREPSGSSMTRRPARECRAHRAAAEVTGRGQVSVQGSGVTLMSATTSSQGSRSASTMTCAIR